MLRRIVIRNYALIEALEIELNQGLNVITGETGAGKSIIIDAITLLLGQRGNKENIRKGTDKMTVQAEFDLSVMPEFSKMLDDMGIEHESNTLLLSRSIDRNGKNSCRANGMLVTVGQLKEMAPYLIDVHSQHEHNKLFTAACHRQLLDHYAGETLQGALREVAEEASRLKTLRETILALEKDSRDIAREKERLSQTVSDIEKAGLRSGEEKELEQKRDVLANREVLYDNAMAAVKCLNGDEEEMEASSVLSGISVVQEKLSVLRKIDPGFKSALALAESAASELKSILEELSDYINQIDFEAGALDVVENRLAEITAIKRRYGASVEEVIAECETAAKKLALLADEDGEKQRLKKEYLAIWQQYKISAHRLCEQRKEAAKKLKGGLESELHDLAMEKAQILVQIDSDEKRISPAGQDHVEFLISINPGIEPQPIRKVASGGEISRIMLALKSLFAEADEGLTMIFDEIDTGISGRTAQKVAEKILNISRHHQLICITHLPQIAAMADRHFRVRKDTECEHAEVRFTSLSEEGSAEELARMLSGAEVTQIARDNAKEMLAMTRAMKQRAE